MMEGASEELDRRSRYLSSLIQHTKLKPDGELQKRRPQPAKPDKEKHRPTVSGGRRRRKGMGLSMVARMMRRSSGRTCRNLLASFYLRFPNLNPLWGLRVLHKLRMKLVTNQVARRQLEKEIVREERELEPPETRSININRSPSFFFYVLSVRLLREIPSAMANSPPAPAPPLDLGDLKAVAVLGRGAKGVVFLVRSPTYPEALALKAISRSSIENKNTADAYRRIWFERDVLLALRHPLLPSLRGVVSTDKIVGVVIQRCSGGDLNSIRRRQTEKMFSDDAIRFYAAELVLALEYLHGLGIVYRDLKPENVLIQENGHLMLIDFDLSTKLPARSPEPLKPSDKKPGPRPCDPPPAKKELFPGCFSCNAGVSPDSSDSLEDSVPGCESTSKSSASGKSNSFVGTEDYVAPEIIQGDGHDFAVDWWSLGVVLYEMLYGRTPFRGQNRKETFYRILLMEPELTGEQTPLRDLLRRLLEKDPGRRISLDGVKQHEFFRGIDWESVLRIPRPPYIPAAPEWEAEEDTEGNNSIDVEKLVQEVFGNVDGNGNLAEEASDKNSAVNREEGLRDPSKTVDFSVF
ncbi:serine/threonine-protein kinase OXI1-like [Phoenix dactylifera]|uniref:non-specific serine/threonine protein kinase n=1 Tax=Phoenix dactylifera TaxID=42345 RepID=A0A8B9ASW3_PHODC|nr:serine/threonine-protein kinase OXI1-like [Phoenix dactylifera]